VLPLKRLAIEASALIDVLELAALGRNVNQERGGPGYLGRRLAHKPQHVAYITPAVEPVVQCRLALNLEVEQIDRKCGSDCKRHRLAGGTGRERTDDRRTADECHRHYEAGNATMEAPEASETGPPLPSRSLAGTRARDPRNLRHDQVPVDETREVDAAPQDHPGDHQHVEDESDVVQGRDLGSPQR
jgi:hypothetical protein